MATTSPVSPSISPAGGAQPDNEAELLAYLTQLALARGGGTASVSSTAVATAVSDAEGNVVFKDLALGRYSLSVRRDGYLNPSGVSTPSAVVEIDTQDPVHDVLLGLSPGGSITGRVVGAGGRPPANATIEVGALGYRDGRVALVGVKTSLVDSAGNYRVLGLMPGSYLIRETDAVGRASVWFPGTADVEKAASIAIRGNEEVVGIDFDVSGIRTFKVSGIVLNAPARTLPNGTTDRSVPGFSYSPRDPNSPSATQVPLAVNGRPGPNGEFEIDGVPAGSWDLFPLVSLPLAPNVSGTSILSGGSGSRYATGRAPIEIVDRDITGVSITLGSAEIKGRVLQPRDVGEMVQGIGPLQISLVARDNAPSPLISHLARPVTSDANGEFSFFGVVPGRYSLRIPGLPAGFYISDIQVGTKSIYEEGIITVGTEPVDPVVIRIRNGSGRVHVLVQGIDTIATTSSGIIFSSQAALVPTGPRRQNAIFYQTSMLPPDMTAGVSRTIQFNNVPPGEYKVFAWRNLPIGGAEMNSEFISKYEDQGVPVTVTEGQEKTVQVKLIP